MQNRRSPYNSIGLRQQPHGYQGYQGYGGMNAAPKPVQSVAEILSEPLGDIPPDLRGASGTASRQREIADMLTGRVMGKQATGIADGLAQLGEAWIARKANRRADAADSKRDEIISMLTQKAAAGDEASIAQLLSPEAMIGRKDTKARQGIEDARYTDERDYSRGRDQVADTRYTQQWDYSVGRDEIADTRYVDELDYSRQRDQMSDAERRAANAPRDIWQSAGEGVIFNQRTGAYQNVSPGGTGSYGGTGGGGGNEDPNSFVIPTSAMNENPFIQMQFGGTLTQGAPSFFDNGEIYTPTEGDTEAAPGGGRPPNITSTYNRYRSSELAKNDNKELGNARTEAVAVTSNLLPQIAEMRELVGTFPMGITSDIQYQVGRVAGDAFGLGMSPEEQGNRDAFLGQSKKLALALGRDLKPFSNSDRDWIQAMVANPGQSKESAAKVLDTLEKMAKYRLFYAQGAEMWQNQYGGLSMTDKSGKNFFESWGEWSAMNPVTGKQFSGDAPTKGTGAKGGVRSGAAGGRGGGPVQIKDDAQYDALPSGAEFIGPDGVRRRKP